MARCPSCKRPLLPEGHTEVDLDGRRVVVCGVRRDITGHNWDVFEVLYRRIGRTITYDQLIIDVWQDDEPAGDTRKHLQLLVYRLRKKLAGGTLAIETIPGHGLRMVEMEMP